MIKSFFLFSISKAKPYFSNSMLWCAFRGGPRVTVYPYGDSQFDPVQRVNMEFERQGFSVS